MPDTANQYTLPFNVHKFKSLSNAAPGLGLTRISNHTITTEIGIIKLTLIFYHSYVMLQVSYTMVGLDLKSNFHLNSLSALNLL